MKALVVYVALTALTLLVFARLAGPRSRRLASLLRRRRLHRARARSQRFGRDFFRVTPFVVLALYAALWLAKRAARACAGRRAAGR